jgi:general secretion pathway protein F
MPLYRYKALSPVGESLDGQMEAVSAAEVIAKLQDAGNIPVEAKPADEGGGSGLAALFKRAEMSTAQVLQFTQQLATLLGAGQPLDRALQILLDLPESKEARRVIERIRETVRGGAPLSQALEQQHGVFSRLYVNMVRAGEVGGSLHDTLKRLADYLERSKARTSYPPFLPAMSPARSRRSRTSGDRTA